MNRAKWAGMGMFIVLGTIIACSQLPQDTLGPGTGGDAQQYEQLVLQARETYEGQPRSIESIKRSAAKFKEALKLKTDDYDALWQAARVAAWIGEYGQNDDLREEHVRDGITYVNTAMQIDPEGIEARFYHGVLGGLLGDLDNSYGMDAVKQIESRMTGLIEEGADFAHGGPHRVYGVLLLRAPGPPTSIGSLRNARKQLTAAVEAAPDWPENHLYLAELEFAWADDKDDRDVAAQARERLQQYLLGPEAAAPPGALYEFEIWQQRARNLLADNK